MSNAGFDLLIIGGGIAGNSAAIRAADKGLSVAIVTKTEKAADSNTSNAQGGIVYKAIDDKPEFLINDILVAGAGASLPQAARITANEGPEIVEKMLLEEAPVDFDKDESGEFDRTEEAAHSKRRIYRTGFDKKNKGTSEYQAVYKLHPCGSSYQSSSCG